jgi:hypothetical protein
MADRKLQASWARTTASLEVARELLGGERVPGIDDYEDYLAHNELGLAFDVLVEVGASQKARRKFWQAVHEAAIEMKLAPDGAQHAAARRTVQEFLSKEDRYPCPCCGFFVFDEVPGSYRCVRYAAGRTT